MIYGCLQPRELWFNHVPAQHGVGVFYEQSGVDWKPLSVH